MKSADPYDRSALEVRVLSYLNDLPHTHPVALDDLVDAVGKDGRYTIICTVGDLQEDGLLDLVTMRSGDQMVRLLPHGKDVLMRIYSGNTGC